MQTRDLASFMQALLLDFGSSDEDESPKDVVTLSTLHGAKGLEFDLVHLIGCEEGFLPHQRTLDSRITDVNPDVGGADIEEERRLFYVGVTRARERLVLSRAVARVLRGKPTPRTPSRFLSDIPQEMLDVADVSSAPVLDPRDLSAQADAILAMLGTMAGPTK
jgi:DNA helicase-2/ATP-dependent DNA helicase PcrA